MLTVEFILMLLFQLLWRCDLGPRGQLPDVRQLLLSAGLHVCRDGQCNLPCTRSNC
jgi:hypothetical protein